MEQSNNKSFSVLIDTKEKMPWDLIDEYVIDRSYTHLKTGDYSIVGLENIFCIERKRSVSEIAQNIFQDRFKKELERLREFKYKYLLLEASLSDVLSFPIGSGLPKHILEKIRSNGPFILRCLNRMQVEYGFNIVYCDNRINAEIIALNLMKEVVKKECQH